MHTQTSTRPMVWTDGDADLPYISLPLDQLDRVKAGLDAAGLEYDVDEFAIVFENDPPEITINFDRGTDAALLQQILDNLP